MAHYTKSDGGIWTDAELRALVGTVRQIGWGRGKTTTGTIATARRCRRDPRQADVSFQVHTPTSAAG